MRVYLKSLNVKRQTGAVLIMVLLIVALVAGLGIKFAGDYQLGLARAEARWHGVQARAYTYSAEGAAIKILEKDDANFDSNDEAWAVELPLDVEGGRLFVSLRDANSKFNLNSLAGVVADFNIKDPLDPNRYSPAQRMFIRLLQTLPNPEDNGAPLVPGPAEAAAILEAIVDWTDQDKTESGSNGAEDGFYLSQPEPYYAANMPFRSLEELQMVRGISPAIMKALRPYVTVLMPVETMNINTMEPVFYRCINVATDLRPLDATQASNLQQSVPSSGHYSTAEEINATFSKSFGAQPVDKDLLGVKTNFFWLTTVAQIGDQRRSGRSLLQRGTPTFKVVRREEVYGE